MFARELGDLFDYNRAGRHVQPHSQSFGCEHQSHEPFDEAFFDNFFEGWHQTCMVRADARFKLIRES